jgi:acyl-[acyl carrier protein]--UDP-N-acetylglucosamine O-acyltransferase
MASPSGKLGRDIHPTAIVSPHARIGEGTVVGPFTIIGDLVRIGRDCQIGAYCELGIDRGILPAAPLAIGDAATIRSHCIIYEGSSFGNGLRTGHHVIIREGTVAGVDFQVGTLSDIQGHCAFGDHVRLHSSVHVGQHSKVGSFVWIFPHVVLTNDPHPPSETRAGVTIEDFALIATMSTILPGKRIGEGALVGAMTLVREDVPPDTICVGVPGRNIGGTSKIQFKKNGKPAYPWRRHFRRGYPDDIVQKWISEFPEG